MPKEVGNVLWARNYDAMGRSKFVALRPKNFEAVDMLFAGATICLSPCGKYIFVMRGEQTSNGSHGTDKYRLSGKMFVYDILENRFRYCLIRFPPCTRWGSFQPVIIRDRKAESLLTFGYTRGALEEGLIKDMPWDLANFILHFVCYEYIHMIGGHSKGNEHIRVKVDDIMRNIRPPVR